MHLLFACVCLYLVGNKKNKNKARERCFPANGILEHSHVAYSHVHTVELIIRRNNTSPLSRSWASLSCIFHVLSYFSQTQSWAPQGPNFLYCQCQSSLTVNTVGQSHISATSTSAAGLAPKSGWSIPYRNPSIELRHNLNTALELLEATCYCVGLILQWHTVGLPEARIPVTAIAQWHTSSAIVHISTNTVWCLERCHLGLC